MKTIIVPTDFSEISLNAINYATEMALATGTRLNLLYICPVPVSYSELPVPAYTVGELVTEAEAKLKELKKDIIKRTSNKLTVQTEVKVGSVLAGIEDYCNSVRTYAVVMGAESGNAFERFIFGAKSLSAITRFPWPLIIVPGHAKFGKVKIGLACDMKGVVDTLPLDQVGQIVRDLNAELHIVHIGTKGIRDEEPNLGMQADLLMNMLGPLKPFYHFLNDNDTDEAIVTFAKKLKLDMLIVVPKKHALIESIFGHSHTKAIALHTSVPLMAIPANS